MNIMKLYAAIFTVMVITSVSSVMAAGGSNWPIDHMDPDVSDKSSLQRGAQLYMNYCLGCHSLQFQRYKRTAQDLSVPENLFAENLIFSDAKIGDLIEIPLTKDQGKSWFGAAPPDLSLVARSRGVDWLYTYLRTFYVDESRPLGVNNKTFPNVGMPHALLELQGTQICKPGPIGAELAANGGIKSDPITGERMFAPCGALEVVEGSGLLSSDEYDQAIYDLVNFLNYVGDPSQADRARIGSYVLLFIAFFSVFAFLLNREYWKDVH